jgi:hypothetical protein
VLDEPSVRGVDCLDLGAAVVRQPVNSRQAFQYRIAVGTVRWWGTLRSYRSGAVCSWSLRRNFKRHLLNHQRAKRLQAPTHRGLLR